MLSETFIRKLKMNEKKVLNLNIIKYSQNNFIHYIFIFVEYKFIIYLVFNYSLNIQFLQGIYVGATSCRRGLNRVQVSIQVGDMLSCFS